MGITDLMADYVARTKFEDFPDKVVLQAKHCIQNVVGCALGGAQIDTGQRQIELGKELGGKPESTIIGDGTKISRVFATYTNAEVANVLDFDDGDYWSLGHPGCPVVSSALAFGESIDASGKDVLTAAILGYDVGLRLAHAMRSTYTLPNGKQDRLQMLSYKAIATATVASKLLGLKSEEISNAFGVVGSTPINRGQSPVHPAGTALTFPYAETKYDEGIYALLGVFGTLRSRKVHGIKNILDTERFWKPSGATNFDATELTLGLGEQYDKIMNIYFKPAPFCGQVTRVITAVWEALKGERLLPQDIESITLTGVSKLPFYKWETVVEAEFSTPCAVAFAVSGEEPGPRWYATGRYKDPDIFEIASKVKFVDDPKAWDIMLKEARYICTVEIKTRDGKVRSAHVEYEKGIPQNPLSEDELHQKFMNNSRDIVGEKRAEKLWDILLDLDKAKDVSKIFS